MTPNLEVFLWYLLGTVIVLTIFITYFRYFHKGAGKPDGLVLLMGSFIWPIAILVTMLILAGVGIDKLISNSK